MVSLAVPYFCDSGGEALEVALAREPRQRQRAKRPLGAESKVQLFCANLPWGMDDAALNAIFADSGSSINSTRENAGILRVRTQVTLHLPTLFYSSSSHRRTRRVRRC